MAQGGEYGLEYSGEDTYVYPGFSLVPIDASSTSTSR